MPITITLDERTYDRPDTLEVGLTEERYQVALEVLLAPQELTGRGSRLEVKPPPERADRALPMLPDDPTELEAAGLRILTLERSVADVTIERDHYADEAHRLADELTKLGLERAITRHLLPDEARELAAVLWHYANEADR